MPRFEFCDFRLETPPGWEDISDQIEETNPPTSLARTDGVGALQFTIARYVRGRIPDPSSADLLAMLVEFVKSQRFTDEQDVVLEESPVRLASASYRSDEFFFRVWYVSDGQNFAKVTYFCEAEHWPGELAECELIVRSIEFGGGPLISPTGL